MASDSDKKKKPAGYASGVYSAAKKFVLSGDAGIPFAASDGTIEVVAGGYALRGTTTTAATTRTSWARATPHWYRIDDTVREDLLTGELACDACDTHNGWCDHITYVVADRLDSWSEEGGDHEVPAEVQVRVLDIPFVVCVADPDDSGYYRWELFKVYRANSLNPECHGYLHPSEGRLGIGDEIVAWAIGFDRSDLPCLSGLHVASYDLNAETLGATNPVLVTDTLHRVKYRECQKCHELGRNLIPEV